MSVVGGPVRIFSGTPRWAAHLVNLCFVKMGNRFDIGAPSPSLTKKHWSYSRRLGVHYDGIIKSVRVVVLEHLARALLEVGGGHDFQVGLQRQPLLHLGAVRTLGNDGEQVETLGFHHVGITILISTRRRIRGWLANRIVVSLVKPHSLEHAEMSS